ncbi:MAG: AAA family ATPase [Pseudomonadota bacterium]
MTSRYIWPKGQEQIFERLKPLVLESRLSQVLIVYGKHGIGKATFLKRLAALMYCDEKSACGACPSCNMVISGLHPDVFLVDSAEKQLKVDHAKDVSEHLSYTAKQARVVIIEDIDRMNEQGVNRLLKVLEEPPEDSYVIMSTSRLDALLPTLKSRALKFLIAAPSKSDIRNWIQESKIDLKELDFEDLCLRAGNSPGVILELLERENDKRFTALLQEKNPQLLVGQIERFIKECGYNAKDVVTEMEYALNLYYRECLGREQLGRSFSLQGIMDRRASLKKLRYFAVQKKISLNALSALESVLLTESV